MEPDDLVLRQVRALERIAETLDDYMEMTLSGQELLSRLTEDDPVRSDLSRPLLAVFKAIRERRGSRA